MEAYVGALGLSAIRVLIEKDCENPCWLRLDLEAGGAHEPALVTFDSLLFSKASHAELVHAGTLAVIGAAANGEVSIPAAELRDAVVNAAGSIGAPWRSMAETMASADETIEEVEKNVEALNKSGALRPLNARYKAYRFAMMAAGEVAINYSAYLQFFKLRVVKLIGQNIAVGAGRYQGFSEIIPSLVVEMDGAVRDLPMLQNTERRRAEKLSDIPSGMTTKRSNRMRMLKV